MSDIKLRWNQKKQHFDLAKVANGSDLEREEGLETAVAISLFTDRRVDEIELPDGETHRRGWWGEQFQDNPSQGFGSKLWLLEREKQTEEVRNRAIEYCQEALAWLVDEGIAKEVQVECEFHQRGVFLISVNIVRPTGKNVFRYSMTWGQGVGV